MKKIHWTQRPGGRERLAAAIKAGIAARRAAGTYHRANQHTPKPEVTLASRAVARAAAAHPIGRPPKTSRHAVRVLHTDGNGNLQRDTFSIKGWGELIDALSDRFTNGKLVEISIECAQG